MAYATAAGESFETNTTRMGPLRPRAVGRENPEKSRRSRILSGMAGSDRQLVTALVSTRLQDGSAGAGAHSGTKTVSLGASAVVWLKRTLHVKPLFDLQSRRFPVPGTEGTATTSEKFTPFGNRALASPAERVYGVAPSHRYDVGQEVGPVEK